MVRSVALLLLGCSGTVLCAQVRVDRPIILEGIAPGQRQVLGLHADHAPASALPAGVEQDASHRSATPLDPWSYVIEAAPAPLVAGTHLILTASGGTTGPISLTINGAGPFALTYGPGQPVDGASIPAGEVLSVVFDGTDFQLLNGTDHRRRACPAGTVAISEEFCITPNQHSAGALAFFPALDVCAAQGMRFCSWGEWIQACARRDELGLVNMLGDWEWTNDAANEDAVVRTMGIGTACVGAGASPVTTARTFRCCYSR